jgi:hypothetical protein
MRELFSPIYNSNQAWNLFKSMAIFLYRCCGYTNPTQSIATTGDWFSHEYTGTAGAFTGTAQATGTITTIASASHVNGEQMTLDDGWNVPTVFTFSNAPSADTDIDITGSVSADVMRDRIIAAINGISTLEIEATDGGAATVDLENYRYGTRGNATQSETVANVSFVLTNTTGGLDGWVLTDSGFGSFTQAMLGSVVCVVDPTNAVNNGVYRIIRYINANSVELDFRADPNNGEAFTAASGLTWYLWADTYELPQSTNDYGRLDSPHSSGWAIEFKMPWTVASTAEIRISIAVDGNWGGSRILGVKQIGLSSGNTVDGGQLCMEVDTDGDYLNMWMNMITGEAEDATCQPSGVSVWNITTIEPDREDYEKVVLFGPSSNNPQSVTFTRLDSQNYMGGGRIWDEPTQTDRECWLVEPSYRQSADGYSGTATSTYVGGSSLINQREPNNRLRARAGRYPWDLGKVEVWDGSLVIVDPDNLSATGSYEIVGWTNGHLFSRRLEYYGSPQQGGTFNPLKVNIQCNKDGGSKNRIHPLGGFIFTWPDGITYMMRH